ncbi:hypothetical protein [Shewanella salipaludis]|uniref:RiboL-PSP-HEPN domain-containing protein n=1 Tax=Shewanella salipaludis TaxID=2723052 RepID=A0A972FXR8_9GAMM|nr:hypothetical protein [Shewanella salipaludis]NMH64592.1 hypothetical protein [Shewanella salipaludis]
MGSIKEYMFDLQEEEMTQWIREHLDDDEADEETPGWDDLTQEWSFMQESLQEEHEYIQWYTSHSYSELHRSFQFQIHNLRDLTDLQVAVSHEETFYKMAYAHAVTLMESFLADSIRSLIISDDKYFQNAITKVEDLKDIKYTLKDIAKQPDGARGFAIKELSGVMYHNIPKVREILKSILGQSISIDISDVCKITTLRHDIVHRDGKTTDGNLIKVDKDIALEAIDAVEVFVEKVASEINRVTNV